MAVGRSVGARLICRVTGLGGTRTPLLADIEVADGRGRGDSIAHHVQVTCLQSTSSSSAAHGGRNHRLRHPREWSVRPINAAPSFPRYDLRGDIANYN